MNYIVKDIKELPNFVSNVLDTFAHSRIFAFYGDMGVGKTTCIKEFCLQLGSYELSSSPTFSIVNEYITNDHQSIYHFDFYRIEKLQEVIEIGFEDYIYSGNYCFIEWSEKIEALLNMEYVKIVIEIDEQKNRHITITEEHTR